MFHHFSNFRCKSVKECESGYELMFVKILLLKNKNENLKLHFPNTNYIGKKLETAIK